ncbi:unnamed protein product [Leptidea sinapis]|uniref:Lipocalin/cytosolic fatty-acid binding domain-containing protein n=1 Tax=Leptidea sinapis TaxID=189913 RepID=A0A5E4Q4G3_9NEOP|nr:unnamed protein product [Leptidea sinapis]
MQQYLCKQFVQVGEENFEDYLIFIGKGYLARKAALNLRPTLVLTKDEFGTYTLSFRSALISSSIIFTPGEEFDEVKPDGVKVRAKIEIAGNKLIHTQTEENGRSSLHIREYFDDRMIITTTAGGLEKTAIRYFELVR